MKRKFQRTKRRVARYRLGSGYRDVVLQFERPTKTEKLSSLFAQWAQIATLAVLVFGYFYTVRPVFQKERLDEEVAQLQIQRTDSTKRLAELSAHEAQIKKTLAHSQSENQKLHHDNDALRREQQNLLESASVADRKRTDAIRQLFIAQNELNRVDALYLKAAQHIFTENLQIQINFSVIRSMFFFSSDYSKKQLMSKLSSAVPDITLVVNTALDGFTAKQDGSGGNQLWLSSTFQGIVKTFRNQFNARRANIRISKVDPGLWADAYLSQLREATSSRSTCVDKYWEGLARHEKWSPNELSKLRSNQGYAKKQGAIFERYCSIMGEYEITKSFNDAWSKYYGEAVKRIGSIPQDISQNKQMTPFPKELLLPPTFQGVWVPKAEDLQFSN